MAIANIKGNYLRVTAVHAARRQVDMDLWESKAKRDAGESQFSKPIPQSYPCGKAFEAEMAKMADGKLSIQDNLTTAGYNAVKTLGEVRNEFSEDV